MAGLDQLLRSPRPWLADGGLETELIWQDGINLPLMSAFVLLFDPAGRQALARYFTRYLDLAEAQGRGFVLDTATWRANMGWAAAHGLTEADIRAVNRQAVDLARDVRAARSWADRIAIAGVVGPLADGAAPSAARAFDQHAPQIEALAQGGVDLIQAMTLTTSGEALGIARRAMALDQPVALSFTLELDGRLPSGQTLTDAIAQIDDATSGAPVFYGIDCAHPTHFLDRLRGAELARIGLIRPNASARSHAELAAARDLDAGDPLEFGVLCADVARRLPGLRILGGCSGTDVRHVAAAAGWV